MSNVHAMTCEPRSLVVDHETWEVWYRQRRLALTPTESRMLLLMMQAEGRVVPTESLARALWPEQSLPAGRAAGRLYVLVSRLRSKLPSSWEYEIQRVRSRGYVLNPKRL